MWGKIRRVIAQHQRRARRPSTPSLHLNKIYSTFTLWPTGARDSVVVEVLVDSLLGLFHQPALASPVPTIRSVPDLLVLRGVRILFVTCEGQGANTFCHSFGGGGQSAKRWQTQWKHSGRPLHSRRHPSAVTVLATCSLEHSPVDRQFVFFPTMAGAQMRAGKMQVCVFCRFFCPLQPWQ